MQKTSLAKINTFKHAIGMGQLNIREASNMASSATFKVPRILTPELLSSQSGKLSAWEKFYWDYNSTKLEYLRLADYIPSSGFLVEFEINAEESYFAYMSCSNSKLVIDLIVGPGQSKDVRNNARLIFVTAIPNADKEKIEFDTFNHKGKLIQTLTDEDKRAKPLSTIAVALFEMFARWLAFISQYDPGITTSIRERIVPKGKIKPGLLLKTLWDVQVGYSLESANIEIPVNETNFIDAASSMLSATITEVALDVSFDYWVDLDKYSKDLKNKYSKLTFTEMGATVFDSGLIK